MVSETRLLFKALRKRNSGGQSLAAKVLDQKLQIRQNNRFRRAVRRAPPPLYNLSRAAHFSNFSFFFLQSTILHVGATNSFQHHRGMR
jgi:hypothetical protein